MYCATLTPHCARARGGELFDYIVKKGKFSEDLTKFMCMQLLDAVKYLHS